MSKKIKFGLLFLVISGVIIFILSCKEEKPPPSAIWNEPFPLGSLINTEGWEDMPWLSADGKTLYFVYWDFDGKKVAGPKRLGNHGFNLDIYVTHQKPDGSWEEPVALPSPINTELHEMSESLSPDENTIYFSRSATFEAEPGKPLEVDLCVSHKNPDGSWGEPLKLPISTEAPEDTVALSFDQKKLFFESFNREPGVCGWDLYVSTREDINCDTCWSTPKNLGLPINTQRAQKYGCTDDNYFPGDQTQPFFSPDGKTLYFISLSEEGGEYGGYADIYKSVLEEALWSKPEAIEPPINSKYVDSTLTCSFDEKTCTFLRNKKEGMGTIEIWMVTKK